MGEDGAAAATGAGAAAGKGRKGGLESGGRAVLVAGGKKSTLPPLFCRTRAVRSIGLPQLHAATMVRRGKARVRKGEGISHLRTSKLFHRSLAHRRRRHHGRWLFRWLWGIKAGELGTIARGCCCGVNWGLLESNEGELSRAAPKTQKSFTENP